MNTKAEAVRADPLAGVKKAWKKAAPLRRVLMWAFTVHGTIRLGTDFVGLRQPFILSDVLGWWAWFQERWTDLGEWWNTLRGMG